MNGVKDMALAPVQTVSDVNQTLALIERMVKDDSVDVSKLERLVQMHERATARASEGTFNAAMSDAQKAMRPIAADATNPQTRSRYASYEALDRALRPIYTERGFGLSFDTGDAPHAEYVRVLCYVTHAAGHSRTYKADMPADGKGAKGGDVMTKTHAVGSAMSYGMRYLLKMIFNVAVGEDDDDGNRAAGKPNPSVPDSFDQWWSDMCATADTGVVPLQQAWAKSKPEFKTYVDQVKRREWNELKKKAAKVPS